MTFTEFVQVLGGVLFLLFISTGLWFAWNAFWEWIEKKWGGKDK